MDSPDMAKTKEKRKKQRRRMKVMESCSSKMKDAPTSILPKFLLGVRNIWHSGLNSLSQYNSIKEELFILRRLGNWGVNYYLELFLVTGFKPRFTSLQSPLQSGPFGTVSSSLLSFLASSSHLVPKDICIWKPWVGSWPCHLAEAVRSHLAIIDLHLAFTS